MVPVITPFFDTTSIFGNPETLENNKDIAFIGALTRGMGFIIDESEAKSLIGHNQINKDVVFPYLTGQDVNSTPQQEPSRWVINFHTRSLELSQIYEEPMQIIRERVYPERMDTTKNQKITKIFGGNSGDHDQSFLNGLRTMTVF